MDPRTPKNYVDYLHNRDWLSPFLRKRIESAQMLNVAGRRCESLNGPWRYVVDQYATSLRAGWFNDSKQSRVVPPDFDFATWDEMEIPATWNTATSELYHYEGYVLFTREFSFRRAPEERVFLHFAGVQYRGYVFLNGTYLGVHFGGSTPFSIEVTDVLEDSNRLVVAVDNTRRDEQVPGSNTDWFNYGGMYRDVEILRVPRTFIRNYRVYLIPDGTFQRIAVEVFIEGDLSREGIDAKAEPTARVAIAELGIDSPIAIENGAGRLEIPVSPELWSPRSPRLYTVRIRTEHDMVEEDIGFREIAVSGGEVRLNGETLFFRGVACHEESLEHGKRLTEAEIRRDLTVAKDLGCNYVRLAHYPHSRHAARIADEMGIMLWEEIPVYWAIDFENRETIRDAENQLRELIGRDWNRASVVVWSVGNENPDTDERLDFMSHLADTAKGIDPTRPVSAACLVNHIDNRIEDRLTEKLDIVGINEYVGWYDTDFAKLPELFANSAPEKPVFITEFGAGARPGYRGGSDEFFTEDKQKQIYERQIQTLRTIPYIAGISPWILFDFRSPRRLNAYQNGYNRKGIIAEDKATPKAAYRVLHRFYGEW